MLFSMKIIVTSKENALVKENTDIFNHILLVKFIICYVKYMDK